MCNEDRSAFCDDACSVPYDAAAHCPRNDGSNTCRMRNEYCDEDTCLYADDTYCCNRPDTVNNTGYIRRSAFCDDDCSAGAAIKGTCIQPGMCGCDGSGQCKDPSECEDCKIGETDYSGDTCKDCQNDGTWDEYPKSYKCDNLCTGEFKISCGAVMLGCGCKNDGSGECKPQGCTSNYSELQSFADIPKDVQKQEELGIFKIAAAE